MKKAILWLMVTAITTGAAAQTSKMKFGGHGAGVAEITWLNGKPALGLGAFGGVLINHRLLIGAAGNNIFLERTINGKKGKFQFNYYGLYTEYKLMPEKAVNLSVGLTGAMGWQENKVANAEKSGKKDGNHTYVIQPKLALNVKVTRFMQVQTYGSYRVTGNTNSRYTVQKNYNGAAAGIGLVFGTF